jgi:hypothetical protein
MGGLSLLTKGISVLTNSANSQGEVPPSASSMPTFENANTHSLRICDNFWCSSFVKKTFPMALNGESGLPPCIRILACWVTAITPQRAVDEVNVASSNHLRTV